MDKSRLHFGLGRENGLTFWAMVSLEAAFGSYFALWPLWIEELGASIGLVGLLIGLSGVLRMFIIAPSAALARRFGMKRVIVVARVVGTAGLLWAAMAQHWTWLLPAMLCMSVGEMIFPLISTSIAANAGPRRVRAFAIILTTGPSVSLLLTPLLSGGLVELWGLRAPFVSATVFSLISLVCFARLRPVATLDSVTTVGGSYGELLRLPGVRVLVVMQFATFFGLGLGTSLLSNFLHDAGGYRESSVALLSSLTAVGSILYSVIVARSVWLAGAPLRAIAIATSAAALGYLLFLWPGAVSLVVVAFILRGGFFVAWPLFSAALGEATPARLRPHAYAMGEILSGTGFITAPVVAGQLYNVRPELPLIAGAALILPLAILLARMRPTRVEEPHERVPSAQSAPSATPSAECRVSSAECRVNYGCWCGVLVGAMETRHAGRMSPPLGTRHSALSTGGTMSGQTTDAAEPAAEDLTQLRAPEEFRRAIVKDPFASTFRFDFDAARGLEPIAGDTLPRGGEPVPASGFYFDLDGLVINWYRAGTLFPKYAPTRGPGGHFFFVTDRRDATVADLLWIVLRAGWPGNVLDIHVL